jgi:hypothetical protein
MFKYLTLIISFFFVCNSLFSQIQITIPQEEIYSCIGQPINLPRVRVISDSNCYDSSLINYCPIYTMILSPTCGCDQMQYMHYDITPLTYNIGGICPSQLNYWSGGNGGVFTNIQLPLPGLAMNQNVVQYTPSNSDYAMGYSILNFTYLGVTQSMKIIYTSGVNLGPDRTVCLLNNNSFGLTALVPGAVSNVFGMGNGWINGNGTFFPSNLHQNPIYTPSNNELTIGFVNLIFKDNTIQGSCNSDTINYFLAGNIGTNFSLTPNLQQFYCVTNPILNISANINSFSSILWIGEGTFASPNAQQTSYSLSNQELQTGYGNIMYIATDQNNCSITDTLNFNFSPKVDILNDNNILFGSNNELTICANFGESINLMGKTTGLSNSVNWSSNGTGNFNNPSSLNSTYFFSNQDINNGYVNIYLQSFGCSNPIDSIKIKINHSNNLITTFNNVTHTMYCGQTLTIPQTSFYTSGSIPWGALDNSGGISSGVFCYGVNYKLDSASIPFIYNNGYYYVIGPFNEGQHLITSNLNQQWGGCTQQIDTFVINVSGYVLGFNDTVVCENEYVTLWSNINSPNWSNNVQDSVPFIPTNIGLNQYVVVGFDSLSCHGEDTINVVVIGNSNTIINQFSVDSFSLNGINYTQSGVYTQNFTGANGCDSIITLNLSLGFSEINIDDMSLIRVFPNPTANKINIEIDNNILGEYYYIFDYVGKLILSGILSETTTTIPFEEKYNGIYTLHLGKIAVKKFVVINN